MRQCQLEPRTEPSAHEEVPVAVPLQQPDEPFAVPVRVGRFGQQRGPFGLGLPDLAPDARIVPLLLDAGHHHREAEDHKNSIQ